MHRLPINLLFECLSSRGSSLLDLINPQAKEQLILKHVKEAVRESKCVLIYTTTRKNAEKLANLLNQADIEARYNHGKLKKSEKDEVLQAFKAGELNVVTATCAFGMGINRADVRCVIHHTMSANLENYIQEAGRAGRDGEPATCTLLFDEKDAETNFFLQSLNQLSEANLHNIFISTRSLRDRLQKGDKVSQDWFWVSAKEIFQASLLDEELAGEPEQRDTKIKVALHHLESFGLLERAENLSTFVQFELVHKTPNESYRLFEKYAQSKNLPACRVEEFKRLIYAMHFASLARAVIEVLYDKLHEVTGARMRVESELGQLLFDVVKKTQPLTWYERELEAVLLWLHQRKLLRLTEGLNLFQQALTH